MLFSVCVQNWHTNPLSFPLYFSGAEAGPSVCVTAAAGSAGSSGTGGTSRSAPKGQGPAEKEEGGSQKRVRRQWESWSTDDKNSFFEGLYEVICQL